MPERRDPPRYRAYLLRCWAEGGQPRDRPPTWRFSTENPHSGERRGFAGLDALVAYLATELAGGDGWEDRGDD